MAMCYVWGIDLYGLQTLRQLERKYLKSFEMWCWRRMETMKSSEEVTNQVLEHIEERRGQFLIISYVEKPTKSFLQPKLRVFYKAHFS
jgi:hypothetical protein